MYRLGLTGPASSGKTTILNDLRPVVLDFAEKKGLEVVFQEERVRQIFEAEFSHYKDFDELMRHEPLRFQLRASEALVEDAFSHQNADTIVISDRIGLDILVYVRQEVA